MDTTTLDGDSPKRKASFLILSAELIEKPKLLAILLSKSVINKPPSATSWAEIIKSSLIKEETDCCNSNSTSKSKNGVEDSLILWYATKYSEQLISFNESPSMYIREPEFWNAKVVMCFLSSTIPSIPIVGVGKTGTSLPSIEDWL